MPNLPVILNDCPQIKFHNTLMSCSLFNSTALENCVIGIEADFHLCVLYKPISRALGVHYVCHVNQNRVFNCLLHFKGGDL